MEMYYVLDKDTKAQINLMAEDGVHHAFIARQLNIPTSAVSQHIQKREPKTSGKKKPEIKSSDVKLSSLTSNNMKIEKMNNSGSRKGNNAHSSQTLSSRNTTRKRKLDDESKEEEKKRCMKKTRRSDSLDRDLLIKFGIKRFVKVNLDRLIPNGGKFMNESSLVQRGDRRKKQLENIPSHNKSSTYSKKDLISDVNRLKLSDIKSSREALSSPQNTNTTLPKSGASKRANHSSAISNEDTSLNKRCNRSKGNTSSKDESVQDKTESLRGVREKILSTQDLRNVKVNTKFGHGDNLRDVKSKPISIDNFRNSEDRSSSPGDKRVNIETKKLSDTKDSKIRVLSLKDFRATQTLTLGPKDLWKKKHEVVKVKEPSLRDIKITSHRSDILKNELNKKDTKTNSVSEFKINSLSFEGRNKVDSHLEKESSSNQTNKSSNGITEKRLDSYLEKESSSNQTNESSNGVTEKNLDFIFVSNDENKVEDMSNDDEYDPLSNEDCKTEKINSFIANDMKIDSDNENQDINSKCNNFENRINSDVENRSDSDDAHNKFISKENNIERISFSEKNEDSECVSKKDYVADRGITDLLTKADSSQGISTKDVDGILDGKSIKEKKNESGQTLIEKEIACCLNISNKTNDSSSIATDIGKDDSNCNSIIKKVINIDQDSDKLCNKSECDKLDTIKDHSSHLAVLNNGTDISISNKVIENNDNINLSTVNKNNATNESLTDITEIEKSLISNDSIASILTDPKTVGTESKTFEVDKNSNVTDNDSENDMDVTSFDNNDYDVETSEEETSETCKETKSKMKENESCEKSKTDSVNCDANGVTHDKNENLEGCVNTKNDLKGNTPDGASIKPVIKKTDLDKVQAMDTSDSEDAKRRANSSLKSVTFASTVTLNKKRAREDTETNSKSLKLDNNKPNPIPFMSKIEDVEFLRKNISKLQSTQNNNDDHRNRRGFKFKEERIEDCMYSSPKYSVLDTENLMHSYKNLVCGTCYKHIEVKFTSTMAVPDTEFQIRCGSCNHLKRFKRSKSCTSEVDFGVLGYDSLYLRLVFSSLDFGGGYSQLQSTCMALNIPQLNLKSFKKYCKYIISQSEIKLDNILKSSAEVVHLAYDKIGVCANEIGVKEIKVLFDSSWIKMGKNDKWGLVVVIDVMTGLVLDYHLMIKHCFKCTLMKKKKPKSFELWRTRHKKLGYCQVNCESEQEVMVRDGSIIMCRRSVLKHKLKYKSFSVIDFDIEQCLIMEEDQSISGSEESNIGTKDKMKMSKEELGSKPQLNTDDQISSIPSEMECDDQLDKFSQDSLSQEKVPPIMSDYLSDEMDKDMCTESEKITDENLLDGDGPEVNLRGRELTLSDCNDLESLSACEKEVQELNEKSPNHVLEEINISLALDLGNGGADDAEESEDLNFVGDYLDDSAILTTSDDLEIPNEWLVGQSLEPDLINGEKEAMIEGDGNVFCNYNESELKIQTIDTAVEQDSLILMEQDDDNAAGGINEEPNSSFNKELMSLNYDENREMASLLTSNVVDQEITKDETSTPETIKENASIENSTQESLANRSAEQQEKCNDFLNKEKGENDEIKKDKIIPDLEKESEEFKDAVIPISGLQNQITESDLSTELKLKIQSAELGSSPGQDEHLIQRTEKDFDADQSYLKNEKVSKDILNLGANLLKSQNSQITEKDLMDIGISAENNFVRSGLDQENHSLLSDKVLLNLDDSKQENTQIKENNLSNSEEFPKNNLISEKESPNLNLISENLDSNLQNKMEVQSIKEITALNQFLEENENRTKCDDDTVMKEDGKNIESLNENKKPDSPTEIKKCDNGKEEICDNGKEKMCDDGKEEMRNDEKEETCGDGKKETCEDGKEEICEDGKKEMCEDGKKETCEDGKEETCEDGKEETCDDKDKNSNGHEIKSQSETKDDEESTEDKDKESTEDKTDKDNMDQFNGTQNADNNRPNVFEVLRKIKFETLRSNVLKNCNTQSPITKEMVEFACNYAIIAHNINIENFMGKQSSINNISKAENNK